MPESMGRIYLLAARRGTRPVALLLEDELYRVRHVGSGWVERSAGMCRRGFSIALETGDLFLATYEDGRPFWNMERIAVR